MLKKKKLTKRRDFIKKAGLVTVAGVGTSVLSAPYVYAASRPIKWRLQTYSSALLGKHIILPQIESFNIAAHGEMEIELYYVNELVPTDQLFKSMQAGTLDAVQSDDTTNGSPVDIQIFGGCFPFAARYGLDVPALFKYYGLNEIWKEAYNEVRDVTWLSTSAWGPCNLFTVEKPINSLADMKGLKIFGAPSAVKFMSQYGLIPVVVAWDEVEEALQTGEIDGVCWCGFTEAYEVGWADTCNYALTNSLTGARFGSYFANSRSWDKLNPKLQELYKMSINSSHYYRQAWYWGGEANLRAYGEKMKLTNLSTNEWSRVTKDSKTLWNETSKISSRAAKVVDALKLYKSTMEKAGYPYS